MNIVEYLIDKPVTYVLEVIAGLADTGSEHPRITAGAIAAGVIAYTAWRYV